MPDESDAKQILTASFPPWKTGGATGTPPYYLDVDYPARIIEPLLSLNEAFDRIVHSGE